MTGEISLRGLVLPIGGVKEKVLAALRAGITTVMLPARNRRDLEDIPADAREQIASSGSSRSTRRCATRSRRRRRRRSAVPDPSSSACIAYRGAHPEAPRRTAGTEAPNTTNPLR